MPYLYMSDTTDRIIPEVPAPSSGEPRPEENNAGVRSVDQDHTNVGNAVDGSPEKKEHTRSRMAILFVLGFFAILFLCFVYAIMVGASLTDLKDTLVGVIGALSGILGFIVGYYYKTSQEQ